MRLRLIFASILVFCITVSNSSYSSPSDKLREWNKGVWISSGGELTVWTNTHYFVVSAAQRGETTNLYCGSSQIRFTDSGIVRQQIIRARQSPGSDLQIFNDYSMYLEQEGGGVAETPLEIDMNLFTPGACNIVGNLIYDSVIEETDDFILISSCDGDRVKLFSDGRKLYIRAKGGESWSYRIETF